MRKAEGKAEVCVHYVSSFRVNRSVDFANQTVALTVSRHY